MKSVFFILNVGERYGFGHFIRCVNLKSIFNKKKIFFLIKKNQLKFVKSYSDKKIKYLLLSNNNIIKQDRIILNYIKKFNCDRVITDLYTDNEIRNTKLIKNFHYKIKKQKNIKLLSISDVRVKNNISDFVFIPNSLRNKIFKNKKNQITFGGLNYNYLKSQKINSNVKQPKEFRVLSIFLSAKNRNKEIKMILEAILKSDLPIKKINIFSNFKIKNLMYKKFYDQKIIIRFFKIDKNFLKILSKSDIFITSEGTAKYDSLALGVTTCVVSFFNYKNKLISDLVKKNFLFFLGYSKKITKNIIKDKLNYLNNNKLLKNKIFNNQIKNFDTNGLYRFKKVLKTYMYI
tara:strand:+ start:435 stop:1472 length:1038 start_codon:yes stop_codon:yes gene_type:complete